LVPLLGDNGRVRLRFEVQDTGIGLRPEDQGRLFQNFSQVDGSITRRFGGTGLGLAISRDLAELMGGTLDAHGEPGRGATFTLELPLERAAPAAAEAAERAAPATGSTRLRVLLAEDHAVNRTVVQMMLADTGAELHCVENGQQALHELAAGRFDVVLMDMQMPVMDGLTSLRRLRERERSTGAPPTPVFMLSANAMPEHVQASLEAGAERHITKPVSAPELLGALAEVARQKELSELAA
jgi:CheY-like chemotaxis protein